jgi:hypothetical protein
MTNVRTRPHASLLICFSLTTRAARQSFPPQLGFMPRVPAMAGRIPPAHEMGRHKHQRSFLPGHPRSPLMTRTNLQCRRKRRSSRPKIWWKGWRGGTPDAGQIARILRLARFVSYLNPRRVEARVAHWRQLTHAHRPPQRRPKLLARFACPGNASAPSRQPTNQLEVRRYP